MNITKILNTLIPEYQIKVTVNKVVEQCQDYDVTSFDTIDDFDTVLQCIVHNLKLDFKIEKQNMIQQLRDYTFLESINIKKVIMSIESNQMNNEVKLFLSGYYQVNIYVYHTMSRIMKIFYLEDSLCVNNESILLFYKHDLNPSYQTTKDATLFTYNDNYIQNTIKNTFTIPVGLTSNKILTFCEKREHVPFITGKLDEEINFINEDNILFNNNIDKLIINEVYDYRTFDVKAFNMRYNEKEFLSNLYSLKTK
jgi:hypothetical protein